ncbi:PIG-L family deacetylase [Halomonas ventosae]|uniref:GlcNAc-PI de-N-acetylase n=1 Tax=Halomonas ventosae TaxID=229007 RepID=A0A2T0VB49_9GAMM|nr:PIG-L family deacetylase [Halomonas ventosae]PRY67381.1 GlcNAc-PI de-N-acetylase [Halomonas ventosae]
MMTIRRHDHDLPFVPDLELPIRIRADGHLCVIDGNRPSSAATYSWLLQVEYRAHGRWRLPAVTTCQHERELFTQYLEPSQAGKRLLNLTGITDLKALSLISARCRLDQDARLLAFRRPALDDGPILIIAPHPDDAELAAYGLYRHHHDKVWIVTLTAGERQKRLDRQYLPGLDNDTRHASRRKGRIRAWNSATTPLLAGVPAERLVMLGYFNDTLPDLLDAPDATIPSRDTARLSPGEFRAWNLHPLVSDHAPANRGTQLLQDLSELVSRIQPATVVVTHPEVDPHPDHVAAAKATAIAMRQAEHLPERVLLYANHLRGIRGFPRGPAHAAAGTWPLAVSEAQLGPWSFHSEVMDEECQKEKALALDTMNDLRTRSGLEKRVKRWITRQLSGLEKSAWKDYGDHDYFQTHIKAHEPFAMVSGNTFVKGMLDSSPS